MGEPFSGFKLPPGHHGLSREYVAENQRWRLLGAAADLLAEGGCKSLTSRKIAGRAAVSSQTFYIYFENVEDCLRAAFEVGAKSLEAAVHHGCAGSMEWRDQVGEAVGETVLLLAREPPLGQLFSAETCSAMPRLREGLSQLVASLAGELQRAIGLPEFPALIRFRLLIQATFALLSEAPVTELREPSWMADELTTLIARGCAPWTSP